MVELASSKLNISQDEIAIASTGVIGRQMPMDIFLKLEEEVIKNLDHSYKSSTDCAEGIMTTDTFSKEFAVEVTLTTGEKVKIGAITKGTGMIYPNMGTMLSFLVTDAVMAPDEINKALKIAVDDSYNMIVVDGDESTNDIALLMANGKSNVKITNDIDENFQKGLNYICQQLAIMMVKDGEGASKFLEVNVKGAKSVSDAKKVARAIVSSNLFKAAVFGADPNWGRIVMAIGYAGADINQNLLSISIGSGNDIVCLVENGKPLAFEGSKNLLKSEKIIENKNIEIIVDLNLGDSKATAWGCDLTYDYVKINAEYTT